MTKRQKYFAAVAFTVYFLCIHVIAIVALFAPEKLDNQRWRWSGIQKSTISFSHALDPYFQAVDQQAGTDRVIIIGDSHCQRFDTTALGNEILNFCAGGDTLDNIVRRMQSYQSIRSAQTIFVWAGTNDMLNLSTSLDDFESDFRDLINIQTNASKIHFLSLPPPSADFFDGKMRKRFIAANKIAATHCNKRCNFVNLSSLLTDTDGNLRSDIHIGDGLHLNARGYCIVKQQLETPEKTSNC